LAGRGDGGEDLVTVREPQRGGAKGNAGLTCTLDAGYQVVLRPGRLSFSPRCPDGIRS
jgi:hypothetical protein